MSLIYYTRGALLTIGAAFVLSTACFAADTQKWAPPNVVGMPGSLPERKSRITLPKAECRPCANRLPVGVSSPAVGNSFPVRSRSSGAVSRMTSLRRSTANVKVWKGCFSRNMDTLRRKQREKLMLGYRVTERRASTKGPPHEAGLFPFMDRPSIAVSGQRCWRRRTFLLQGGLPTRAWSAP